ncbi:MAG: hypothetical protein R3Y36_07775, partial [Spirochaetales bacterium]
MKITEFNFQDFLFFWALPPSPAVGRQGGRAFRGFIRSLRSARGKRKKSVSRTMCAKDGTICKYYTTFSLQAK